MIDREHVIQTPTGQRVLYEFQHSYCIVRTAHGPAKGDIPHQRLNFLRGINKAGSSRLHFAPDGIFLSLRQLFAAMHSWVYPRSAATLKDAMDALFWHPVAAHDAFVHLFATDNEFLANMSRMGGYDRANRVIYNFIRKSEVN